MPVAVHACNAEASRGTGRYSAFHMYVVRAFRLARHGGPEGPHYTQVKSALTADQQPGRDRQAAMRAAAGERPFNAGLDIPSEVLARPEHEIKDRCQTPERF